MSYTNNDILNQLSQVVAVIPTGYITALLTLHEKLGAEKIKWIVSGDLAQCLRTVQVEPDCIEIVTSEDGAKQIFQALKEFKPNPVSFQTHRLARNAVAQGQEYPVYARSHYCEVNVNGINVRVYGDLQFKVGDWDWGELFDFTPEYVCVAGNKTAVTPLSIQYEFYQSLGWIDRAEGIGRIIKKPLPAT